MDKDIKNYSDDDLLKYIESSSKSSNNASAKLTENKVILIRENYSNGISRKDLAKEFNVSRSLIDKIVTNKIWISIK